MGLGTVTAFNQEKTSNFRVRGVADLAAVTALANTLQSYCDADLRGRQFAESSDIYGTPAQNGPESSVEFKAVIVYRDEGAGADETSIFKLELPGPKASIFEAVSDKGYRVKAVEGAAIVAALATATGKTLSFVRGYPKDKRTVKAV